MITTENHKPSVFFIMHLPPPIHGAAITGNHIKSSRLINSEFVTNYTNLATNVALAESGKGSFKKVFKFFGIVGSIVKMLNRKQFDLCYMTLTTSGLGFYKDFLIVLLLKAYGRKIIYHFHNKGVSTASHSGINRLLFSFAFRNTKSIVLSSRLYTDIRSYVPEKDVYYCPYGIPVSSPEARQALPDQVQPCRLLFLGNMISEKGIFVLLDAAKELKSRGLAFECHYVGGWADVSEEDFQRRIAGDGLESVVFAHGPRYGNEKNEFLAGADVFVFPTFYHYEAFPLVNLEAMQYSLPVVSTQEGGIPDMITDGETGFLVPQRNAGALADKLERLIRDPALRRRMGEAGKKRFDAQFTLDRFEQRITDIIGQAARA